MEAEQLADTVFILSDRDISVVQGSTEMYYLTQYFGEISDTHVFAPTTNEIAGVNMHSKSFSGTLGTIMLNILYLPFWVFKLARHKPDIIYCYQNVITPPLLAKYLFGATVIFDLRSDPCEQAREFSKNRSENLARRILLSLSELLHKFVLPRGDLVVTLSQELESSIVRNYGVESESTHILPLGVDLDKFERGGHDGFPINIIYIGAVHPIRGIGEFLEGLFELSDTELSRVKFHIYGDGDTEHISNLIQSSEDAGFEGFTYHGRVPHHEIPDALKDADVALSPLPALRAYEVSSPAKIFEYLAAGLPIIASDITPHRRLLKEEYAFFVKPKRTDYAETVQRILHNTDRLEPMSKEARSAAISHSWSKRFEDLTKRIAAVED